VENSSRSATLPDSPIVFPPNGFSWFWTILFLVGMVVVFFAVMAIGVGWYYATHGMDLAATLRSMSAMPGVTIQSIAEVVAIAFIALLLPPLAQTSLRGIGFQAISGRQVSIALLGAVLMFVIVTPLASVLETLLHFKAQEEAIAVYMHVNGWQKLAFAFFGIVVAPAFEESLFRVVLFNAMRRWWGFWAGAVVSSILFGLAHSQPPFTAAMLISIALPLAVGGFILSWVYARTNNAWASFITHGTFNGLTFVLLTLAPNLAK
jgi:membrane protease YdiL (CAAX protease family)